MKEEGVEMYEASWYVWVMVLTAVLGLCLSAAFVLYRGGHSAQMKPKTVQWLSISGVLVLVGLLAVSWILVGSGSFETGIGDLPAFLFLFPAVLGGLLLTLRLPLISRALDSAGAELIAPHTFRLFGGVFLIALAQGALPAAFALPAALGDMAIGVAAPFVAWRLARGGGRGAAIWFNVLGLLDLVLALTIGLLAAPVAFQALEVTPSTAALTQLPLALIPRVAVPIAITLHIASLARLRSPSNSRAETQLVAEPT